MRSAAPPTPPPRPRRRARRASTTTTRSPARRRRSRGSPSRTRSWNASVLGLEAVRAVAGRPRDAEHRVDVEQDRDVGREAAGRPVVERADALEVEPAAVALVGDVESVEAVADARPRPRRARHDLLGDELGATGLVQQQLGARRRARVRRVEQEVADAVADGGAAGLAQHGAPSAPAPRSRSARSAICVDLPAPSPPSNVMNTPAHHSPALSRHSRGAVAYRSAAARVDRDEHREPVERQAARAPPCRAPGTRPARPRSTCVASSAAAPPTAAKYTAPVRAHASRTAVRARALADRGDDARREQLRRPRVHALGGRRTDRAERDARPPRGVGPA